MINPRLTALVNRKPADWVPDWTFFVLDPQRTPHEESVAEAAVRAALQTDSAEYRHIMPLLMSLDRREWSRWVTSAEDDYKPEWFCVPPTVWTDAKFRASGGKSVWPPRQTSLPLASTVTFARVSGGMSVTMNGESETLHADFLGGTATIADPSLHGRIILDSGSWAVGAGVQASAVFHPSSYPWKHAADTLATTPGIEDFLLDAGTLPQWSVARSDMDKVGCVVAGLVTRGLRQ